MRTRELGDHLFDDERAADRLQPAASATTTSAATRRAPTS
jgi:hypothetical protein